MYLRVEQQVLRLDVAVDQVVFVQILEGVGNLLEGVASQDSVQINVDLYLSKTLPSATTQQRELHPP